MTNNKECLTCKAVDFICRWEDMPEKYWKRPVLLFISSAALIVGSIWYGTSENEILNNLYIKLTLLFFGVISILSIIVSIKGCDRCVAKLLGQV